jgi:hypothetical protein
VFESNITLQLIPSPDKPSTDKPSTDKPSTDKPSTGKPSTGIDFDMDLSIALEYKPFSGLT